MTTVSHLEHRKNKSDDSFTLGTLRTDTREQAHTNATATKKHERRKRGPLEVELKSNELIPSDPILNLITLCVGAVKVRIKVTTVLHLETLEE